MNRFGTLYEWACDSVGLLCWMMGVGMFCVAAMALA